MRAIAGHNRQHPMLGATVVFIDSCGCMAQDRHIEGIGRVKQINGWGKNAVAIVEYVQRAHQPYDVRDKPQGSTAEYLCNGALQQMGPHLWFVFR
jgi:hypothetical protein